MACTPDYRERLVDLSHGRLSAGEADSVLVHAMGCSACGEELELLADLPAAASASRSEEAPAGARGEVLAAGGRFRGGSLLRVAAAVLVVGLIVFWANRTSEVPERLRLLADITPVPFLEGTLRGERGEEAREAFENAIASYNAGRWEAAARELEALLEADPEDHKLRVYLGIALLQLGRPFDAQAVLEPATEGTGGLVAERALWYLGMSQLLAGDGAGARRSFEKLAGRKGSYELNARDMLEELEKLEEGS